MKTNIIYEYFMFTHHHAHVLIFKMSSVILLKLRANSPMKIKLFFTRLLLFLIRWHHFIVISITYIFVLMISEKNILKFEGFQSLHHFLLWNINRTQEREAFLLRLFCKVTVFESLFFIFVMVNIKKCQHVMRIRILFITYWCPFNILLK